jgi:hypothetical protein
MEDFVNSLFRFAALAPAIALIILASPSLAATLKFSATLTAAAETPPTTSGGSGTADATFDTVTKALTWTITHKGLTGEVKAAHFHGPAAVGAKASPVLPIVGSMASPIKGKAVLTDPQAKDLENGLWYFNLHTAKYPDGELRGQLVETTAAAPPTATTKMPAPATAAGAPTAAPPKITPQPLKASAPKPTNQFATEVLAKAHCPSATVVWVNFKSQIFHFSGNKDYGTTKDGAFMCETDASAEGARAAKDEKHP